MIRKILLDLGITIALSAQQAPPYIAQMGVMNAASHLPPGLPGGGLAPGSRIHIYGQRLGAGAVEISQGGRRFRAVLVSASAERIEAILPGELKPGDADLTVSYAGQISQPFPLRVVARSFGIASVVREGDTIVVSGTGLGVMPAVTNVEVFVGGRAVPLLRRVGPRTGSAGTDEIVFDLPSDALRACNVPVQVRVDGSVVSNAEMIDLAEPGQACSVNWMRNAASLGQKQGFVMALHTRFQADLASGARVGFAFDAAAMELVDAKRSGRPAFPVLPALGTCDVVTGVFEVSNVVYGAPPGASAGPFRPLAPAALAALDAGESITLRGPRGERLIERSKARPNEYLGLLGGNPPLPLYQEQPLFLCPGPYEISAGGGEDVGEFRASLRVDHPVRWTDRGRTKAIDRARGVTVHWKAARNDQIIAILAMNADQNTGAGAFCVCTSASAAGRFRIPPVVLANLPPTEGAQRIPVNFLAVAALPGQAPEAIHARGLDAAFAFAVSAEGRTVVIR